MNYYEHHIRDYDAATVHLSWEEDLAYTRLIRWYYRKERPLPADLQEVCRQMRATTKKQRDAVASVLREFFELHEDGWHHDTCDEAIARYQEGEPEREAKKANEENRWKRHREERSQLFKTLTEAGHHAPWNIGMNELRELVSRITATAAGTKVHAPATQPATAPATPATGTATQPATAPATPATATQSPDTRHQTPVLNPYTNPAQDALQGVGAGKAEGAGCLPGDISKAMRENGVQSQPADPRIITLAEQGVSIETVQAACIEAKASKPNEPVGVGYVVAIIQRWAKDASAIKVQGARAKVQKQSRHNGFDETDYSEGVTEDGRIA